MEADAVARSVRNDPRPFGGLIVLWLGCDKQIAGVVKFADFENELMFASVEEVQANHSATSYFQSLVGTPNFRAHPLLINERYRQDHPWGEALIQIGEGIMRVIPLSSFPVISLDSVDSNIVFEIDQVIVSGSHEECNKVAKNVIARQAAADGKTMYTEISSNECLDEPLLSGAISRSNGTELQYDEFHWIENLLCSTMLQIGEHPPKSKVNILRRDAEDVLLVRFENGELFPLPKLIFYAEVDGLRISRCQFPLRYCAFATPDAVQGRSMNNVYINDLLMGHGRTYVALSRARTRAGVAVLENTTEIRVDQNQRCMMHLG